MAFQSIPITNGAGVEERGTVHHSGHRGIVTFFAHFAEMTAAMMVGMMPGMAIFSVLLGREALRGAETGGFAMAVSMAVPMAAWMIVRGHTWRASAEMAAAMIVPVTALFPLFWLDLISKGTLVGLEHGVMMPAMIAAMLYRRHEYGL